MTNHPRSPRAKFRLGQVVAITINDRSGHYALVMGEPKGGRVMLRQWDVDNSEQWEWEYDVSDLRPLTKKEIAR